jgi:hypothetical protein
VPAGEGRIPKPAKPALDEATLRAAVRAEMEAALREEIRSEIDAALEPLRRKIEQLAAAMATVIEKAFSASTAGNLAGWALTHPDEALEWLERLSELITAALPESDPG